MYTSLARIITIFSVFQRGIGRWQTNIIYFSNL